MTTLNKFIVLINNELKSRGYMRLSWDELDPVNVSDKEFINAAIVIFEQLANK